MPDPAQQSAIDQIRDLLTQHYARIKDAPTIDTIHVTPGGTLELVGYNHDGSLLHSRINSTPTEYLAAMRREQSLA